MKCRQARNLLALHVGGDLPGDRAAGVDAHLSACAACAGELARHQAARRDLRLLQADPLPLGSLWERLEPRLAAVDAAARRRAPWYRRPGALSAAAAALLLCLAVPWFLAGAGRDPAAPLGPESMRAAVDPNALESGLKHVPKRQLEELILRGSWSPDGAQEQGTLAPVIQAGNRGEF